MSDIFISYKREDQAEARALAQAIEAQGWTVWWDPRLRTGDHFDEVIERELTKARCVIVVWSTRSIRSQYVKDEAAYALNLKKLIPVTIDQAIPPFRFQGLHTLSLAGWNQSPNSPMCRKLLDDIESLLGSPSVKNLRSESKNSSEVLAPQQPRVRSAPEAKKTSTEDQPAPLSVLGLTATYGKGFRETEMDDRYLLKVYVNAFSGSKGADARAKEEIESFMKTAGYASYEIINRRGGFLGSYYEYTVQFKRIKR